MVYTKTLTDYEANAKDFDQYRQPNEYIVQKISIVEATRKGEPYRVYPIIFS